MKSFLKSRPFFRKTALLRRFSVFGISSLLIFITVTSGCFTFVSADNLSNWFYSVTWSGSLGLNPENTQWAMLDGKLTAISLEQGRLLIYNQDENGAWLETQSLIPPETSLTTFITKDINGDGIPEIIAGTTEPGYIYIYKYEDSQWLLHNYEKYIWSSITYIAAGNLNGPESNLLVQNQDGYLYLLKITAESLDIVWKSPTVWRLINSAMVLDIDNDSNEEIIVAYKTGGIGVLKLVNNQIISVWDNFLWGKILALTSGDWDNDKSPEIMISTSQKIIYVLGGNEKGYQFEDRITQLNYIAETLAFTSNNERNQLYSTDTSGKFHYAEYNPKTKQWQEQFFCQTGRISQIIPVSNESILLWAQNRKLAVLNAFRTGNLKLKNDDIEVTLTPSALYRNNAWYVSPKALSSLTELEIGVTETKTTFSVTAGQTTVEIVKTDPGSYKLNGEAKSNQDQLFMIAEKNLYFSDKGYLLLFHIHFKIDPPSKTISYEMMAPPVEVHEKL